MKSKILFIAFMTLTGLLNLAQAQDGEQLYKANCASCHTIGGGKLVGPDLIGVHERREEVWLLSWIKSSQTMVNSGDEIAVKLFEENNKIPMPDPPLNEDEIKSVLEYIKMASVTPVVATITTIDPSNKISPTVDVSITPGITTQTHNTPNSLLDSLGFTGYLFGGLLILMMIVLYAMSRSIAAMSRKLQEVSNGK